jgi:hypothetical protein
MRVLCWFSCGDASAVATALALKKYRDTHEVVVARIRITSEHEDNDRFAADCSKWFNAPITNLANPDFADTWDVWEKKQYISGIHGAPCTTHLKKEVRRAFQRPDDLHIFGYTYEERKRAKQFRENNVELNAEFPLIDKFLSKPDCHSLVQAAGIQLPVMYSLGFDNNNCIGCPKGGAAYWNMIRTHFPDVFWRMADLSRKLGCRLIKLDDQRMFLDELDPSAGNQRDEPDISCSAFCNAVEAQIT